jgi:hypothetical protein
LLKVALNTTEPTPQNEAWFEFPLYFFFVLIVNVKDGCHQRKKLT